MSSKPLPLIQRVLLRRRRDNALLGAISLGLLFLLSILMLLLQP